MIRKYLFLSALYSVCVLHTGAQGIDYLERRFRDHKDAVNSVAFSPDGKYLVTGGEDKILLIYDLATREPLHEYTGNYFPLHAIRITLDNKIFVGSGSDIKLIDFTNNTLAVYEGNSTYIWSIAYAPERNKIAAGSYDYKLKVWDVDTRQVELELEGHKKSTLPVAFSPDEKYLVTGSLDKTIKIWNAKTGELLRSMEKHSDNIYDIAFHPSGQYFASASRDKTIRLWNFETGEVVMTYAGHDQGIMDIEFLPDGNHMVSASVDGSIRLWQTKTGKMVYTFAAHEGTVNTVSVSSDGRRMASGGADRQVLLWDLPMKIFVEFAYYDEFEEEKAASGLFGERGKGEKKEGYEGRMIRAKEKEDEIAEKYYTLYQEELRKLKLKDQ